MRQDEGRKREESDREEFKDQHFKNLVVVKKRTRADDKDAQRKTASNIHQAVIRRARLSDAPQIGGLLHQLGYPVSARFVHRQLTALLSDRNEDLLVIEADDTTVIAFLAMHYVPQMAVEGGFARISYLCVDEEMRWKGLGKKLEREACRLAAERGCDRIELHCHARRTDAHGFYARQGYTESPKYFVKRLRD